MPTLMFRLSFPSLLCLSAVLRLRKLSSTLVLLLLVSFSLPLSSSASTDDQIQQVVKYLDTQDYLEAIELLHDLQGSVANPAQLDNLLAVAYLGHGYQLLASADLIASGEAFQEGRRYNDEDIRLWQGEAMVRFKQGRYAEAVSLLDQAIGVNSQNASLYHLLGQAYYADGRMAEAVDALTEATSLGGGAEVDKLLQKVQREWQVEQDMGQESRGHFQLSFVDGKQVAELAPRILETLEDAYTELGSELAYFPDIKVPVLLYLKKDFSAVTNSPDWAGGVYDGKIRLPLRGMHRMSDQLAAVLYHEYMHVLVHFMAGRRAPVWLNEGLAEMAGRRLFSPPTHHLQQAVQREDVLGWDTLAKPFSSLPADKVLLAYEQSYSLVSFMVDRYGWHKIPELLESIGKRKPWQDAIADVYQDYGLDWPTILREWQASLSL
jgi:tetratricopeptide (TPR) repeat protein